MPGYQISKRRASMPAVGAVNKIRHIASAAKAVGDAVQSVRRASTVSNSETTHGGGLTTQNDKTVQYIGKRRGRKQKKAQKFRKRVLKAMQPSIGSRTVIKNSALSGSIAAGVDTQAFNYAVMYGNSGTTDTTQLCGCADIRLLSSNDTNTNEESENYNVTSGFLDFTFANTGSAPLEVDVYTVIATGKTSDRAADPGLEISNAEGSTPTVGAAGPLIGSQRGVTLFDFPLWSRLGNKITAKTKHFVGPNGGVFTGSLRENRQHYIKGSEIYRNAVNTNFVYSGMTKFYVFVVKKVSGFSATAAAWSIGCTRKILYKPTTSNKLFDAVL